MDQFDYPVFTKNTIISCKNLRWKHFLNFLCEKIVSFCFDSNIHSTSTHHINVTDFWLYCKLWRSQRQQRVFSHLVVDYCFPLWHFCYTWYIARTSHATRARTHTHGHIHDSQALFCVFVAFNYYCTMTVSADIKHLNLFSVWIASHHSLVLLLSSTVLFTPALLICRCCELSLSWKNENKNCDKWKWKSLRQTGKSFVWFIFKMKSILAAATFFAFLWYFGWLTKVFLYAFYCCFVALFCVVCVFFCIFYFPFMIYVSNLCAACFVGCSHRTLCIWFMLAKNLIKNTIYTKIGARRKWKKNVEETKWTHKKWRRFAICSYIIWYFSGAADWFYWEPTRKEKRKWKKKRRKMISKLPIAATWWFLNEIGCGSIFSSFICSYFFSILPTVDDGQTTMCVCRRRVPANRRNMENAIRKDEKTTSRLWNGFVLKERYW